MGQHQLMHHMVHVNLVLHHINGKFQIIQDLLSATLQTPSRLLMNLASDTQHNHIAYLTAVMWFLLMANLHVQGCVMHLFLKLIRYALLTIHHIKGFIS
jgi:hypothetical protein